VTVRLPASHSSDRVDLPSVQSTVLMGNTILGNTPVLDAINQWYLQVESNLLVLMGGLGSGKSTSIQTACTTWQEKVEFIYFDRIITLNDGKEENVIKKFTDRNYIPEQTVIVIENFDAVNSITGFQITPPDLRLISDLIYKHRIILTTRRTHDPYGDELLRQLASIVRLEHLGVQAPFLIQLKPWETEQLLLHSQQTNNKELKAVANYLNTFPDSDTVSLRRPLIITMLLGTSKKFLYSNNPPSLAQIYENYCEVVLSRDFDSKRSRLSASIKQEILSELAYDIFSGKNHNPLQPSTAIGVPYNRVSERVMEVVMTELTSAQMADLSRYNLTKDFITTNHLFEDINLSLLSKFTNKQYGFTHQSFYEYFVSLAILRRIGSSQALGIEPQALSLATLDSLAFAFVKELSGSGLSDLIKPIAIRPRLQVADRLMFLYLLEDSHDFGDILRTVPIEYFTAIKDLQNAIDNFFLKKMIRYQLVIIGQYSAEEYISQIKQHEDEEGLRNEKRLHSSETDVTEKLLQRLRNPSLKNAQLITVYRLGQLGGQEALSLLLTCLATSTDTTLIAGIKEAIHQIEERSK
jgi:hypothetical protein